MVEDPIPHQTSESGSYMHHFHKVWWQLAFYRILKYVFWQQFSNFCNNDGHVGWQPEVFNQNFERTPHMHSFHMVWLHLTLHRIWCIYDPLSDLWLLSLVAYEKWLLSLHKIDLFNFFNSLNIVKSQCCYQTIKEQCIYNSLSDQLSVAAKFRFIWPIGFWGEESNFFNSFLFFTDFFH
jgi:hypothetical protein